MITPLFINYQKKFKKIGLLLLTNFLYAGPPMMTDDPFTPDVNELEINFASEFEKNDELSVVVPIVDMNYGVYPNVQFTLETAYASSDSQYKSDGVEVAVKYNFYHNDYFNIAIYPQYHFYPIETPFDEGETYSLLLPMSLQLSKNLEWVSSLSYVHPLNEKVHYEFGTYLAYTQEKHSYFWEIYLEEKVEENDLATFFNVGYFYQYRDNLGVMGSIGYETVGSKKEANVAYVGLQVIF
jgi:hypothetical protein